MVNSGGDHTCVFIKYNLKLLFHKYCGTGKIAPYFILCCYFGFQSMLRLTDIKLPLDHQGDAIEQAILKKLARNIVSRASSKMRRVWDSNP